MSTAALEAVALRTCLTEGREDLAVRFFYRAAHHIDTPWQIVVGGMPPAPGTTVRKPLSERLVGSYLTALRSAAADDPKLARAFLRVAHMVATPRSLMTPGNVARVLGRVLLDQAAAAGPAPCPCPPHTASVTASPTPAPGRGGAAHEPAVQPSTQPPGRRGPVHHRTGHVS